MVRFVCSALAALLLSSPAGADEMTVDLSKTPVLHYRGKAVQIEPAFEDYAFMLEDVCDAMKLTTEQCNIYPMNGNIGGNAVATVIDGNKVIVYDRRLSPLVGYDGANMIIAHELGHHICGHLGKPASVEHELEADAFAGAAMKLMGRSLGNALSAVSLMSDRPGDSHPAKAQRIKAISGGWNRPEIAMNCERVLPSG